MTKHDLFELQYSRNTRSGCEYVRSDYNVYFVGSDYRDAINVTQLKYL